MRPIQNDGIVGGLSHCSIHVANSRGVFETVSQRERERKRKPNCSISFEWENKRAKKRVVKKAHITGSQMDVRNLKMKEKNSYKEENNNKRQTEQEEEEEESKLLLSLLLLTRC